MKDKQMPPSTIRKMGIEALTRELGAVGMIHFIRQFDPGEGDYTRERNALLADTTMADIEHQLAEFTKKKAKAASSRKAKPPVRSQRKVATKPPLAHA